MPRTRLELQSSNKRKPDSTTLLSALASLRMKMRALETLQTAQRSAEKRRDEEDDDDDDEKRRSFRRLFFWPCSRLRATGNSRHVEGTGSAW